MSEVKAVSKWPRVSGQEITEANSAEPHLLADAYKACSQLYSGIMANLSGSKKLPPSVITSLQRSQDTLKLWAHDYDVANGDLDSRLHRSQRARKGTLRLFSNICRTLTDRLLPLTDENQRAKLRSSTDEVSGAILGLRTYLDRDVGDSDSDTSSDSSPKDNHRDPPEIAADLRTDVQCLLDLGYRFDEQAVRLESESPKPRIVETLPIRSDFGAKTGLFISQFVDDIRTQYPSCRPDLLDILGKAQYDRVTRCQETRDRNRQARQAVSSPSGHSATKPTSAQGVGEYVETVVPYTGDQGDPASIPPLPGGASKGDPFRCDVCETIVVMVTESAWKGHILGDLQPYICLDTDCGQGTSPFLTKAEWEHHITTKHRESVPWQSAHCPICLKDTPKETRDATDHLAGHLEKIALRALLTHPLSAERVDAASSSPLPNIQSNPDTATRKTPPKNRLDVDRGASSKSTFTFTHPYNDNEVLYRYLINNAGMKESDFRVTATTTELRLMLTDDSQELKQKQIEEIIVSFIEARRKKKYRQQAGSNRLETGQRFS